MTRLIILALLVASAAGGDMRKLAHETAMEVDSILAPVESALIKGQQEAIDRVKLQHPTHYAVICKTVRCAHWDRGDTIIAYVPIPKVFPANRSDWSVFDSLICDTIYVYPVVPIVKCTTVTVYYRIPIDTTGLGQSKDSIDWPVKITKCDSLWPDEGGRR